MNAIPVSLRSMLLVAGLPLLAPLAAQTGSPGAGVTIPESAATVRMEQP